MPTPQKTESGLWIVIGDIHDNAGNLLKIPELNLADGVIISGDLTNTGGIKQAEKIMEQISAAGLPVWAQIGNMDRQEVNGWLSERGDNLHCNIKELAPGIAIMGVGGSTFTPFSTPSEFPESDFSAWLEDMWHKARKYPHTVLISHNPPKNTLCDDIGGGIHVGSEAVREFILEAQPDICICGHIHEAKGIDHLGRTVVVNPGQLSQGGYVLLRTDNGRPSIELKQVENA